MYKIIGADQKEYGPISADQIRQWISEGRFNAQSLVCAEGSTEWKPLGSFPEFSSTAPAVFATGPTPESGPSATEEEVLARDYTLDIGECVTKSWELIKPNFWPIIGTSFLVMLVLNVINQVFGLISRPATESMIQNHQFSPGGIFMVAGTSILGMPFSTVLLGGLFRYYLKFIRGQQANISDAFSGFSHGFTKLALLGLIQGILVWVGILFCVIPGIYFATAWYFATLIVADKDMDFWPAMEYSRKVVSKHWFLVFGFLLVIGLLCVCGLIACCIGIFVTMPVGLMAIAYAYENIFVRKAS